MNLTQKIMSLFHFFRNLFEDQSKRPLGNLTYDKAEYYVIKYCELLQEGVGSWEEEKQSRLPTSFERMKEAFKVECLNQCNHGGRFDENCEFILPVYITLGNFLPDDLAEEASSDRRNELYERVNALLTQDSDGEACMAAVQAGVAAAQAGVAAAELSLCKKKELDIEWNEFVRKYRDRYVQIEKEVDEQIRKRMESAE